MRKRNGIVLFVTLMMMMLLLGIVSIFLNKTREAKDNVTYISASMQTNLVMKNLLGYLQKLHFDEDMIYYASMAPFPLDFTQSSVVFKLQSAQGKININSLIRASIKNNLISDRFMQLLAKYDVKEPTLFLNILKDTIDDDVNDRDSEDSEIVNEYPTFRNHKIYNKIHLRQIIDYYFEKSGDSKIYDVPFNDIFSYDNSSVDVNFMSVDTLHILFNDANEYILKAIAKKTEIYKKLDDLPFDDYYTKRIKKGMLGQTITTKSTLLDIQADLNYKGQFVSKISFTYNIKSKKISDYKIDKIVVN